jgi:hypothetical protein
MKDAIGIVIGIVLTLVALVMTITGTFEPFKQNQQLMNQTNNQMLTQVNAEVSNSTSATVTGQYIQSLIDKSVGKSDIITIKVDGSTWNGSAYSACGITVKATDSYTQKITVETGKTVYTFTKVTP